MDHRNDVKKSIQVLFVLFGAIVLTEHVTEAGNSGFIVLLGITLIGLCLSAIFLPGKKGRDLLRDR